MGQRIDRTLLAGEIWILFIGMLHSVQQYLARNITVIATHPISVEAAALERKLREAMRASA